MVKSMIHSKFDGYEPDILSLIMIDSSKWEIIEEGLKYSRQGIVNSISLKKVRRFLKIRNKNNFKIWK